METILSLISFLCFGYCVVPDVPHQPKFPEKELEWIIVYGRYALENPDRVTEAIEAHIKRSGGLKEGEIAEEKYAYLLDIGDEQIRHTQIEYCYNEMDRMGDTEASFPYLKARLYDKEGNVLKEDFLRFDPKYMDREYLNFSVHLPYHKEGHIFKITKELNGKEDKKFSMQFPIRTKAYLIKNNILVRRDTTGFGFQYKEDLQCHTGR